MFLSKKPDASSPPKTKRLMAISALAASLFLLISLPACSDGRATMKLFQEGESVESESGQKITLLSHRLVDKDAIILVVDLKADSYRFETTSRLDARFDSKGEGANPEYVSLSFDSERFVSLNPGFDPSIKASYAATVNVPFKLSSAEYSLLDDDLVYLSYRFGFTDPSYTESLYSIYLREPR